MAENKNNPLRQIWYNMHGRCYKPSAFGYKHYGGKGITVCREWHDFREFEAWATVRGYRPGLEIHRKFSGGSYEPDNCVWVTRSENNQAKAKPFVMLTESSVRELMKFHESGVSPQELAAEFQIGLSTVYSVIKGKSWSNVTGIVYKKQAPSTTLSQEEAASIRKMREAGFKIVDIAEHYGVSRLTISRVVNGHSWRQK